MSQYEGWSNQETFMVASIIDNDRMFLKLIMDTVQIYIVQDQEHFLEDKLQNICGILLSITHDYGVEREQRDYLLVQLRLKATLRKLVLEAFLSEVSWSELVEHYKTKYVENLINDKDILEQIDKDRQSNAITDEPEPNTIEDDKPTA